MVQIRKRTFLFSFLLYLLAVIIIYEYYSNVKTDWYRLFKNSDHYKKLSQFQNDWNVPIWIGESGWIWRGNYEIYTLIFPGWNMYTWYDSTIDAFEKLNLGWSYWIFPGELRRDPTLLAIFQKYWSLNWRPQTIVKLQTSGHNIVTENGENVVLRGLQLWIKGLAIKRRPPMDLPEEEVFVELNSWNVNHIRLVMDLDSMMPSEGVWSTEFFQNLKTVLDLAEKYGIYVILDMHQHRQSAFFGGHGFPSWYVSRQSNITKNKFMNKWLNRISPYQDSWDFIAQGWGKVMEVAKGKNIVIGYDLFNEPPKIGKERDQARKLYEFLGRLVESVDPEKLRFVETPFMDLTNSTKPAILNLVLSPHVYQEFDPVLHIILPYGITVLIAIVLITVILFTVPKLKRRWKNVGI